jgi:FHS family L-fucose permease-like MFS transporter
MPYLAIGIVVFLLAVLIQFTPFSEAPKSDADRGGGTWRELAAQKRFWFAAVAQFFYVGAQIGLWSYLIRYAQGTIPGTPERRAADFLVLSLVLFMIGRFIGAALMRSFVPAKLLTAYAVINTLLMAVGIALPGRIGLCALIAASFFMSIMFPTIFALGIRGLGEARKLASSVIVMAIVGGAVLTPLMGAISGLAGIHWSLVVPLVCFIVVLSFALYNRSCSD